MTALNEVASLRIADIKIGQRHRKELGDIDSLAASIEKNGLLHPIVVTSTKLLVCGHRRIEAFKRLKKLEIPVRIVDLDDLLSAERDENMERLDFAPTEAVAIGLSIEERERVKAKQRQAEGQKKGGQIGGNGRPQAQKDKKSSSAPNDRKATQPSRSSQPQRNPESATTAAAAVGMGRATYEKAKKVIAAAAADPKQFGDLPGKMDESKNVHQTFTEMQRREKRAELEAKAKAAEKEATAKPAALPLWKILTGDCLEQLKVVKNGTVRLCFADPPYNIGIDYGEGADADRLPELKFIDWCKHWIRACRDKLTPDGSLWLMIGDEYADHFGILLREAGLHRRSWIKWYETFGVNQANNFNRTSRHIFYCVKDPKQFVFNADAVNRPSDRQLKYNDSRANPAGKIWDDVWMIPRLVGTAKERVPDVPTQLPIELLRPIIGCASEPGDTVLDPFSGSGTTGVAAIQAGRKFIGIEKSEKFSRLSTQRLKGVKHE